MSYEFLKTPIEYLKGVGPKRAALLRSELNISTFDDLLNYFPFRYVDRSTFSNINEIDNDQTYFQLKGKILQPQIVGAARAKRLTAYLKDDTGIIELVWFQGINWALEKIKADVEYIVFGKPNYFNGKFNLSHPEIEPVEDFDILTSILSLSFLCKFRSFLI